MRICVCVSHSLFSLCSLPALTFSCSRLEDQVKRLLLLLSLLPLNLVDSFIPSRQTSHQQPPRDTLLRHSRHTQHTLGRKEGRNTTRVTGKKTNAQLFPLPWEWRSILIGQKQRASLREMLNSTPNKVQLDNSETPTRAQSKHCRLLSLKRTHHFVLISPTPRPASPQHLWPHLYSQPLLPFASRNTTLFVTLTA